jgi:hypothetical protein
MIADQVKGVLGSSHAAVGRKAVAKRLAGGSGNKLRVVLYCCFVSRHAPSAGKVLMMPLLSLQLQLRPMLMMTIMTRNRRRI